MNQKQTKPKPSGAPMAKIFLIVTVIVSLGAVLGVLGYALTKPKLIVQNPPIIEKADETAGLSAKALATEDWKTYRNEEYWFSVKYPKEAEANQKPKSGGLIFIGEIPVKGFGYGIGIDVIENPQKSSADEWYFQYYKVQKKKAETESIPLFLPKNGESTGLSSYPAYRVSIFAIDHTNIKFYISRDSYIYEISYRDESANDPNWDEHEKIINEILSTFKFIESAKAESTRLKNTIIYPDKQTIWKIGETYLIQWMPKDSNGTADIRLYDNTANDNATRLVFQPSISHKDTGNYSFTVFKGLKPGNRYQFVIGQYPSGVDLFSEEFTIEDETADWKTYRNEEYGFEINYPLDWKVYGTNINSSVDIMSYDLYDPKFELGNENGVKIQIQSQLFNQITSLDKFVPTEDDLTGKTLETEKIVLNNYKARKANMNGAIVYFLTSKDGKTGVSLFIWKGSNENLNKIADQILFTFKFIEKN